MKNILAGVLLGSYLLLTLYSLYTYDIPVGDSCFLVLFADDAAYVAVSMSPTHAIKMQFALDFIPDWLARWRLAINMDKTQVLPKKTKTRSVLPALKL